MAGRLPLVGAPSGTGGPRRADWIVCAVTGPHGSAGAALGGGPGRGGAMGQFIMLGTLGGLAALIFALVLRLDPEARRPPDAEGDR
jgi:hypothetical protein